MLETLFQQVTLIGKGKFSNGQGPVITEINTAVCAGQLSTTLVMLLKYSSISNSQIQSTLASYGEFTSETADSIHLPLPQTRANYTAQVPRHKCDSVSRDRIRTAEH